MYRVVEINELEQLLPHGTAWGELLEQTPHASFFQSLPWLAAHWKHVGANRQLRVLMAWHGDTLAGVMPLNIQTQDTQLGPLRTLTFPIDGWGSFYGPIGPDPAAVLTACLEYLRGAPCDYELVDLRSLPGNFGGKSSNDASLALADNGEVAMLDLLGNWDTYWASRNRDHNRRRNVERCERRLAEQGSITYMRYRPLGSSHADAEPRWDLYDACEELARKSWQASLTNGNTLSHEEVRDFVRQAHIAAVDAGALDLNLLYLDQRPVAFVYAYHYRGYVDLMRIGFDPELAKVAPGNALWTRLIRDSYERGDRVLDLGPTCLDYKKFWLTRVEPNYRYLHYPLRPRAQTLRLARWLKERFKRKVEETNQENKEKAKRPLAAATDTRLCEDPSIPHNTATEGLRS